jgi:arylsulfatase A-like enzyme
MPTICQLAGATPKGDLRWDGRDIWSALSDPAKPQPERTIYTAAPGFRSQAIRHGDWKLIVTNANAKKNKPTTGQAELFNLADDLAESKNLAASAPQKLNDMMQRLADVSRRDRDALPND